MVPLELLPLLPLTKFEATVDEDMIKLLNYVEREKKE